MKEYNPAEFWKWFILMLMKGALLRVDTIRLFYENMASEWIQKNICQEEYFMASKSVGLRSVHSKFLACFLRPAHSSLQILVWLS